MKTSIFHEIFVAHKNKSNYFFQGTTEAVIKKEVPETDVEVKIEPETDVEVKKEDINMEDLKEVEDEETDFPGTGNSSLLNLTADAGVTTAFSYPVASDIKINITSQVKKYFPISRNFSCCRNF